MNRGTPDNPIKITPENAGEVMTAMTDGFFRDIYQPPEYIHLPDGVIVGRDGSCFYRDENNKRIDIEPEQSEYLAEMKRISEEMDSNG